MPQNVRNWWISANVDGKETPLESGPRAKDGGFTLTIYQRDQGGIVTALTIGGFAFQDGALRLSVRDGEGNLVHSLDTERDEPKKARVA